MFNLGQLSEIVQHNCHISDAQHAGKYSMCLFLLKMREYYRWENALPLTQGLRKEAVGDWIVARERHWDDIEGQPYHPVPLPGGHYDPFDTQGINRELIPLGYIYSSGYGVFNKPHFFLGELTAMTPHGDITIYTSDWEYARDLVAPPAMTLNNHVFVRQEPLRRVIWEKIEEWRWKKDPYTPMGRILTVLPPSLDLETVLDELCQSEAHIVTQHELGETIAGKLLGPGWEEMLCQLPRSAAEFHLRAARDHLADCLTTLPSILAARAVNSLHFYMANLTGKRKEIFPELVSAYQQWVTDGNWDLLHHCVHTGKQHWWATTEAMLSSFNAHQTVLDETPPQAQ